MKLVQKVADTMLWNINAAVVPTSMAAAMLITTQPEALSEDGRKLVWDTDTLKWNYYPNEDAYPRETASLQELLCIIAKELLQGAQAGDPEAIRKIEEALLGDCSLTEVCQWVSEAPVDAEYATGWGCYITRKENYVRISTYGYFGMERDIPIPNNVEQLLHNLCDAALHTIDREL